MVTMHRVRRCFVGFGQESLAVPLEEGVAPWPPDGSESETPPLVQVGGFQPGGGVGETR